MTAQIANRIDLNGAFHPLLSAPEVGLWEAMGFRPPFIPQSTANWSGYVSHWSVRENTLYLTDVIGLICTRKAEAGAEPSSWCRVGHFGECDEKTISLVDLLNVPLGGIPALWYTGELRIPDGEMIEYVHAGWASGYERDRIIEISSGKIVSEKIIRVPPAPSPSAQSTWKRLRRFFS